MSKSLEEWWEVIEREREYVDIKPYSHNIITVALNGIAKVAGNKQVNRAIDEFKLEELGWKKVEE